MLKPFAVPLPSPSTRRAVRSWLLHGAALLVLAGCAAMPGEPPGSTQAGKGAASTRKVPDARDNPDAWGALAFRGVPESSGLQMAPADLGPFEQRGLASWYGRGFHGRRTASGERFDMNAFTVAHPSLPLSSWVLVRNLSNDRVVVAKVTDRGPYHGKRILDMSMLRPSGSTSSSAARRRSRSAACRGPKSRHCAPNSRKPTSPATMAMPMSGPTSRHRRARRRPGTRRKPVVNPSRRSSAPARFDTAHRPAHL